MVNTVWRPHVMVPIAVAETPEQLDLLHAAYEEPEKY